MNKLLTKFQELHEEVRAKKGCSTCVHCRHVVSYPGFVTAEESVCDVGLECDTVNFSIVNCPKWNEKPFLPDAIPDYIRKDPCFCEKNALQQGDTLYISSDWDEGIGFDYIRDIRYCPICGKQLPVKYRINRNKEE